MLEEREKTCHSIDGENGETVESWKENLDLEGGWNDRRRCKIVFSL